MADFSPVTSDGGSAFDVPNDRCDTACGVATARDTAGGGARRDIPVGYTCWKFCESLSLSLCIIKYLYIYKYIYIYICIEYMYTCICTLNVHWLWKDISMVLYGIFQCFRGVSAKWQWTSVKRPMWMVAMRNIFSGSLWRAPPRP